jgi:hypothetical protein
VTIFRSQKYHKAAFRPAIQVIKKPALAAGFDGKQK